MISLEVKKDHLNWGFKQEVLFKTSVTKIENWEISENFLLLLILVIYETQNLKTEKMT